MLFLERKRRGVNHATVDLRLSFDTMAILCHNALRMLHLRLLAFGFATAEIYVFCLPSPDM